MNEIVMFLDVLPKHKSGTYKGKINWGESIGLKVPFIYDDIRGEIEILGHDKKTKKLYVSYKNKNNYINSTDFKNGKISKILMKITKDFKIEVGTPFKDDKRDLVVTDREYKQKETKPDEKGKVYTTNEKWYKYTCNKCGWKEGWIEENQLRRGQGCSCCAGRTAVLGINTIWDTDRWMCDLGVSEEDAKRCTKGSRKKAEVLCLDCGNKKMINISNLYYKKSIGCSCSDGISYPEKITISILRQLNIDFRYQLTKTTFEWCDKYKYDFYIPSLNCIIEVHGRQHYEEFGWDKTLKEQQNNDRLKKELASNNKVEHYIELDCRHSDLEWIKNSLTNSELSDLFDLSKIDWLKAESFALRNVIKEVCDYWNNKEEWETIYTIAKDNKWGIKGYSTIKNYLKKGASLGWCDYNPKEELNKSKIRSGKAIAKKLSKQVEIFKDGKSLGVFESASELERQSEELFGTKLLQGAISSICLNKRKQYKGYEFRYIK